MPRRCSSRPLTASVGPLEVPRRSKQTRMSARRLARAVTSVSTVGGCLADGVDEAGHDLAAPAPVGVAVWPS